MATKKTADNKTGTGATMGFNPMAAEIWQEIMTESARFMTERLQKDMATQKAMLGCKSPAELMQVQAEFYQNALSDYAEEANRMLRLMSKAGGTSRAYDDVPL